MNEALMVAYEALDTANKALKNEGGGSGSVNTDAKTVNGHTVESDVPANAVFTDTVYDDTALKERVTTLENQSDASDDDSTSAIALKTGKLVCEPNGNLQLTNVAVNGNGHNCAVYYKGTLFSASINGNLLFVNDLQGNFTQVNYMFSGMSGATISKLAVYESTDGRMYLFALTQDGELGRAIYETGINQLDFSLMGSGYIGLCQNGDNCIVLNEQGGVLEVDYTDNFALFRQIALNPETVSVSKIKMINNSVLAVNSTDSMGMPVCNIYDLETGEEAIVEIESYGSVRVTDVVFYDNGLIAYSNETAMFYRAECGKFYSPVIASDTTIFWKPFTIEHEMNDACYMIAIGRHLLLLGNSLYVYDNKGNSYVRAINDIVEVFSDNSYIYLLTSTQCYKIEYETEELSIEEAINRLIE